MLLREPRVVCEVLCFSLVYTQMLALSPPVASGQRGCLKCYRTLQSSLTNSSSDLSLNSPWGFFGGERTVSFSRLKRTGWCLRHLLVTLGFHLTNSVCFSPPSIKVLLTVSEYQEPFLILGQLSCKKPAGASLGSDCVAVSATSCPTR